jgi:hypothetical protein
MEYWFRPHRYGFGATPANWKGWAVSLIYVAVMAMLASALAPSPSSNGAEVLAWIAALCLTTAFFVWIAWRKTDGQWRWRWGSRD